VRLGDSPLLRNHPLESTRDTGRKQHLFSWQKTTQKTRRIKDYFPWCLDVFLYPHVQVFLVIFAFYQRKKTLLIFEANTDLPRRLRVLALLEFFGHIIDGNIMGIVGYNMFEW
jgi:hypothetical protein